MPTASASANRKDSRTGREKARCANSTKSTMKPVSRRMSTLKACRLRSSAPGGWADFERCRDAAEARPVARGRHQHYCGAAHKRGPAEKGIESIGRRCRGAWAGPLVHGKGFSGE